MLSGTEPSFAGPVRFESDKAVNTDVLFVTIYHNLPGVSDGEEIGYYLPGQEERLSHDLVQAFRHYSSLFASSYDYEDDFSCAEYGVTDDSFDEIETNVFRSVLSGAERHQPVQDLHPRDVFNGCCAVVEARLQSAETRTVLSGVGLLNDLMESGLPADDSRNPRCYIQVQTAQEFAGPFLRWLTEIADFPRSLRSASAKAERVRTGLQPFRDLVVAVEKSMQENRETLSDFVIGRFLLIADHYLHVIGEDREPIYHGDRLSLYRLSTAAMPLQERTGPELSVSGVITPFAEAICKRVARKSISQLQRMTSGSLSGDDAGLENIWDEICAQVQYQESIHWDLYDDIVRDVVRIGTKELQRHEREAIWLQTSQGDDWFFGDEETREQYPVCEDDIVEYLMREHIYSSAANWTNKRIREYLDHDYEID
jgi:hypothetical protein